MASARPQLSQRRPLLARETRLGWRNWRRRSVENRVVVELFDRTSNGVRVQRLKGVPIVGDIEDAVRKETLDLVIVLRTESLFHTPRAWRLLSDLV